MTCDRESSEGSRWDSGGERGVDVGKRLLTAPLLRARPQASAGPGPRAAAATTGDPLRVGTTQGAGGQGGARNAQAGSLQGGGGGAGGGEGGATAAAGPDERSPTGGAAAQTTDAVAPTGGAAATLYIVGPRELWLDAVEALASQQLRGNRGGGTFRWTASPNLVLSDPDAEAPAVRAVAASIAPRDAWIRLAHTDASGVTTVASYRLTIFAAGGELPYGDGEPDRPDPAHADATYLHYATLDQLGVLLPRSIQIDAPCTRGAVATATRHRRRRTVRLL